MTPRRPRAVRRQSSAGGHGPGYNDMMVLGVTRNIGNKSGRNSSQLQDHPPRSVSVDNQTEIKDEDFVNGYVTE